MWSLCFPWRRRRELKNASLARALELAAQGRRVAMRERRTGLYAFWYLKLRADEEIIRAGRNGKELCCLSFWIESLDRLDALVASVQANIRPYDLAAYLDNGHVTVVLLDASDVSAHVFMHRVATSLDGALEAGHSMFPSDGATLGELLDKAKARATSLVLAA